MDKELDALVELAKKAGEEFANVDGSGERFEGCYEQSYSALVAVYDAAGALMEKVDGLAYQLTPEYYALGWADAHYPERV